MIAILRLGHCQRKSLSVGEINIFPHDPGKHNLPVSELTPFLVKVEYSLVTGRLSGEEMTYRQMFSQTSGLELVNDSRNERQRIEFTGESSFCNAQIGYNFFFIVS